MTDPLNPADFFRIIRTNTTTGEQGEDLLTIEWRSFPGLRYELLESETPDFANPTVTPLGPADGPVQSTLVPVQRIRSFFRVRRQ